MNIDNITHIIDAVPVIGKVAIVLFGIIGAWVKVPRWATESAQRLAETNTVAVDTALKALCSGKEGRHEIAVDELVAKYGIPVDSAESIVADVEKVYKKTIGKAIKAIQK